MSFSNGPGIVTTGLVLALDASDLNSYVSGSTTWFDVSGNSNSGSLVNGPTFSSANNGSIVFDGVDDYVNCGNSTILDVGNNITVNSWFYVNSISSYQAIVSKQFTDGSAGWELANSSGNLRSTLRPSATQINLSVAGLAVGNWYMGTFTFNNTTLILYLNGVQIGSTSTGGPVTLNTSRPLQIGVREISSVAYFNGNISNVNIYNRALSAAEVLQNYNALKSRFNL